MYDYEPFHGQAGESGSTNYLFADLHVGDLN
jgi:prepilin-type processing-associated H-X9-DG protein